MLRNAYTQTNLTRNHCLSEQLQQGSTRVVWPEFWGVLWHPPTYLVHPFLESRMRRRMEGSGIRHSFLNCSFPWHLLQHQSSHTGKLRLLQQLGTPTGFILAEEIPRGSSQHHEVISSIVARPHLCRILLEPIDKGSSLGVSQMLLLPIQILQSFKPSIVRDEESIRFGWD